jgi:ribosomal protein L37AE/L43A
MSSPDRDKMFDTLREIERVAKEVEVMEKRQHYCEECGSKLHHAGCLVCLECGWSRCRS